MVYYLLYLFLGLLSFAVLYVKRRQRHWLVYMGAICILFFQALRWRTGTDWTPYYMEFLTVNNPGHVDDFEFGYVLLNSVIRKFTDNFTIFLFVECGLNLLFIMLFLKSMPINNRVLGLLYLFSIALFPIRFTLASNIVLYSYKFIIQKRIVPYALLIFLAFSIHRSTIIFFPLYFICRREYSLKTIIIIYLSCITLGVLSDYTFGHVLRSAAVLYGSMSSAVQVKMDAYITGDIPDYAKMTFFRYCLSLINSTLFILFFYYFKKKKFQNDDIYNVLFNLYVFGISFNRIFFQLIPDFARLTSLFSGGFIIMLIMIISRYSRQFQMLATVVLIAYFFMNYYSNINGRYSDLFLPYYSVFSPVERVNVY